jgi:RNA polymerase sigma factor (sigma-70 family)
MQAEATKTVLQSVDAETARPLGPDATIEEIGYALARRNPDAMRAIESGLGGMIRRYVSRKYPTSDTDDVLQLTLVDLWRTAHRFDPSRSLEAWALTIASRRAIDRIRREIRHNASNIDNMPEIAGDDGGEFAERHAEATVVGEALNRLPAAQQQVLRLGYMEDLTQAQIAERLRVPLGTVKARTFRGLKALRDILDREDAFAIR